MSYLIKKYLHVNYLQDNCFVYNGRLLVRKWEVIIPITDYIIPEGFCQNNQYVINFNTDDMISKFEAFTKNNLDTLYLTESMRTEWIQTLY